MNAVKLYIYEYKLCLLDSNIFIWINLPNQIIQKYHRGWFKKMTKFLNNNLMY